MAQAREQLGSLLRKNPDHAPQQIALAFEAGPKFGGIKSWDALIVHAAFAWGGLR